MTIQTLTRSLQIPTTGLFRFRTERYEVQHFQVSSRPLEMCITLERHTMTSEVTVWLELSGLDFVKPALWDERQLMITAFVERLMHASLTHQAHGSFTGTMQEEAFTQLCRDLSQTIAH